MISAHVWEAWRPPIRPLATEWIPQHVWMPYGTEYDGLFDFDIAPHTRGVLEAWDDESVREITLVWATRNMKTTTLIALMICAAANYPAPMGYGSCDEMSVDRSIDEQIYPMLDRCDGTARKMPPVSRRSRDNIKLTDCRIRKAFGGSPASVAGWPAKYIFINEADKWPRRISSEADAIRGFAQRVKGFPFDSKVIKESSPGEVTTSRVWADLTSPQTDQRRFFVPCPHCGHYQTLDFGDAESAWGIKWDKPKSGHTDPLKAEATAYYQCINKGCKILNEDRAVMMRSGVWLSEGQTIDRHGRIKGRRRVQSSHIGFGPLGSEYSLLISGWGQIAKDFLECGSDPEKLRNFTNSTRALPWDPKPKKADPIEVIERLCVPLHHVPICPEWTVFLTRGTDVQHDADLFISDVVAWGPHGRAAVIEWIETYGRDDYRNLVRGSSYKHADGGPPLTVFGTGVDSGDGEMTEQIYALCKSLPRCHPIKGSSTKMELAFKETPLGDPKYNGKYKGMNLILVNTNRSQLWLESHLKGTNRDKLAAFTLPHEASIDLDYVDQLLNEVKVNGKWEETGPNHHRDAIRYAWAIAMKATRQGSTFANLKPRIVLKQAQEADKAKPRRADESTFATEGGGRQWHE